MHLSSVTYAKRNLKMRLGEYVRQARGLPENIATPLGFKILLNSNSALHGGIWSSSKPLCRSYQDIE